MKITCSINTTLFFLLATKSAESGSIRGGRGGGSTTEIRQCPVVKNPPPCPFTEDPPVVCGDDYCQYPSTCMAGAAGFSSEECRSIKEEYPKVESSNSPVACTDLVYWSVLCGANECEYSNLCYATIGGGFNPEDCRAVSPDRTAPPTGEDDVGKDGVDDEKKASCAAIRCMEGYECVGGECVETD